MSDSDTSCVLHTSAAGVTELRGAPALFPALAQHTERFFCSFYTSVSLHRIRSTFPPLLEQIWTEGYAPHFSFPHKVEMFVSSFTFLSEAGQEVASGKQKAQRTQVSSKGLGVCQLPQPSPLLACGRNSVELTFNAMSVFVSKTRGLQTWCPTCHSAQVQCAGTIKGMHREIFGQSQNSKARCYCGEKVDRNSLRKTPIPKCTCI